MASAACVWQGISVSFVPISGRSIGTAGRNTRSPPHAHLCGGAFVDPSLEDYEDTTVRFAYALLYWFGT